MEQEAARSTLSRVTASWVRQPYGRGFLPAGVGHGTSRYVHMRHCCLLGVADLALCLPSTFLHTLVLPNQQTPCYSCHGNQKVSAEFPCSQWLVPQEPLAVEAALTSGWALWFWGWCCDLMHLSLPAWEREDIPASLKAGIYQGWSWGARGLSGTKNSLTSWGGVGGGAAASWLGLVFAFLCECQSAAR